MQGTGKRRETLRTGNQSAPVHKQLKTDRQSHETKARGDRGARSGPVALPSGPRMERR